MPVDVAKHAYPGHHHLPVVRVGKIARLDQRIGERIGAADRQPAARPRMALPHGGGETRVAVKRIAGLVDRQWHHVELDVGSCAGGKFGAGGTAHLARTDRERPAPLQQPLQAHFREAERMPDVVVERVALLQPHDGACLIVVLQVFADARQGGHHRDAVPRQQLGRADAGQLQELG